MELFKKKEAAKNNNEEVKNNKEEVIMLSKEDAKKIMDEAMRKQEEKRAKKEQKKKDKADRKLENLLELNTPITNKVAELVSSGVITKDDLYDEFGKRKNFLDIVAQYDDHPEEDESENDKAEEKKAENDDNVIPFGGNIVADEEEKQITPAFNIGYTISEDGDVSEVTSSVEDTEKESVPSSDIQNIIINDPDIKEVYPSINRNDISIENGLILIKIPRAISENSEEPSYEVFRLDIVGSQIYIQAPLKSPIPNLETGIQYYFVSVPLCTELGRKIIKNHNFTVEIADVDINSSILRDTQDAA